MQSFKISTILKNTTLRRFLPDFRPIHDKGRAEDVKVFLFCRANPNTGQSHLDVSVIICITIYVIFGYSMIFLRRRRRHFMMFGQSCRSYFHSNRFLFRLLQMCTE